MEIYKDYKLCTVYERESPKLLRLYRFAKIVEAYEKLKYPWVRNYFMDPLLKWFEQLSKLQSPILLSLYRFANIFEAYKKLK